MSQAVGSERTVGFDDATALAPFLKHQHGAIVAREYGKPCVAGIDGVTTKLKDGQIVDIDGGSGVIPTTLWRQLVQMSEVQVGWTLTR